MLPRSCPSLPPLGRRRGVWEWSHRGFWTQRGSPCSAGRLFPCPWQWRRRTPFSRPPPGRRAEPPLARQGAQREGLRAAGPQRAGALGKRLQAALRVPYGKGRVPGWIRAGRTASRAKPESPRPHTAAGQRAQGWRRCAALCLYSVVIFIPISGLLPVSARSPHAPRRSGGRGSWGPVPAPPAGTSRARPSRWSLAYCRQVLCLSSGKCWLPACKA